MLQGGLNASVSSSSPSSNWAGLTDASGGLVRVQVDYQTVSTLSLIGYDEGSVPIYSGTASHAATRTQDFGANAASAGVALVWKDAGATDGGLSKLSYIRVWQQDAAGNWISKWQGSAAQANGSGLTTVSQAQAGMNDTALEYNAFGEVTRKGVNGGRQEYFNYDNAGHLWRSNSGDGIDKVSLYDNLGRQTAAIQSAGVGRSNLNLLTYASADQIAGLTDVRRTDIRYDALGHVVQKSAPERLQLQGGVNVRRGYSFVQIAASSKVVLTFNESGASASSWSGTNSVNLSWASLSNLGSGDVKVVMDYASAVYTTYVGAVYLGQDESGQPIYARDESGNIIGTPIQGGGVAKSRSQNLTAEQGVNGVNFSWQDSDALGGISRVTRVRVYKKDVNGYWQPVVDQNKFGYNGNAIEVAAPTNRNTNVQLQLRPAGSAGDTGWTNAGLINYGDALRFNASGMAAGNYEYRVLTTDPGTATRTTGAGALSLAPPRLSTLSLPMGFGAVGAGIYAWASPGSGIEQVLRVRPAGSSAAWTSYSVGARGSGYYGVDLNGLGAGSYQYELLWTRAGESSPYAHATGQINIVAATTVTQMITPPNPANYITGYIKAVYTSPVFIAFDESGNPILGPHYAWSSGGVVVAVPYTVSQIIRYDTVQVPVQVAVKGAPVIAGYDESGQPVYARDESGNIVYNYTYVTQYQAKQVPVYGNVTVTPPNPASYMTKAAMPIYSEPVVSGYDESGNALLRPHYKWQGNVVVAVPYTVTQNIPKQYSANNTTAANSAALSENTPASYVLSQAAGMNGDSRWLRPVLNQKVDRWGNVVEINDPRSQNYKTLLRYNANNALITQSQPDTDGNQTANSPVTQVFYDQLGRQVAMKDANGNLNGQVFDAGDNVVQEFHADGGVITNSYNAFAEKVKTTDALGNLSQYRYNKTGQLLTQTRSGVNGAGVGVYTVTTGNALAYTATRALTDSYTYDTAGRKLTQVNGNNETIRYAYDAAGNVTMTTLALGQTTRAVFDAMGRKTAEVDANGYAATWSYNYFGLLQSHTDIGGAKTSYAYDNASQLITQTNTRGQSLSYQYDAAGQVTRITDNALGKVTTYAYDLAGHRLQEKTTQGGVVYQDNHLAYDALGRLRDIADERVHISIDYDKAGNRTHMQTHAYDGDTGGDSNRWNAYDAMNRQVVVDGVDAAGNLGTQGHRVAYDKNGNRISDTSSSATEVYSYDALNRLSTVTKNGAVTDQRFYDGADRAVQQGTAAGGETHINRFDANGRMLYQRALNASNNAKYNISYESRYDAAGNLTGYTLQNFEGQAYTNNYSTTYKRMEGYKESTITGSSSLFNPGTTTNAYDVNGNLVAITDSTLGSNNRTIVNDINGQALLVNQAGNVQRTVVVNGEVLGRYGVGINAATPRDSAGNPNFAALAEFDFTYPAVGSNYPSATPSSYRVNAGETLQTIAQEVYGDRELWFQIAQANGLASTRDLKVGQTLTIPNRVGTIHNNTASYRPYDHAKIIGETTPNLPVPKNDGGGCGGVGQIIMIVVAVVATIVTAGAAAMAMGAAGGAWTAGLAVVTGTSGLSAGLAFAAGAIGGAMGSIASQGAAMAMGMQDSFNWKGVGLGALSAGIGAGMGSAFGGAQALQGLDTFGKAAVLAERAAIANALTQGVGVAVGLQDHFSWTGVAASAVGAGAGSLAGSATANMLGAEMMKTFGGKIISGTVAGFAGGATAAVLRGGRMSVEQVGRDAFGNALGNSIADGIGRGSQQEQVLGATFADDMAARKAGNYWNPVQDGVSSAATFGDDMAQRTTENYWSPQSATAPMSESQRAWFESLTAGGGAGTPIPSNSYAQRLNEARLAGAQDANKLGNAALDVVKGAWNGVIGVAEGVPNLLTGAIPGGSDYVPFLNGLRGQYNTSLVGPAAELVTGLGAFKILGEIGAATRVVNVEQALGENSAATAERVLFENKFPLDAIGDPKIVPTQALKNMSGNLNYVVLEDSRLVVGKSPHTSLTNNTSVQAAGEIQLYNGNVKWLDNASGHYQPTGPQIQGIAESAFDKIGLDAAGKFQFKVWTLDPSLPRGGKWVKQ